MEEDRPFLERRVERSAQLLGAFEHPEPAQGVGVLQRIGRRRRRHGEAARGGIFEQSLGGLRRKMVGQREELVLARHSHVHKPVRGHPDGKQVIFAERDERARRGGDRLGHLVSELGLQRICLSGLLDQFPHLDDLQRPRLRMRLDPAALRPFVGVVVVGDVHQHQAIAGLVHDDAQVAIDPHRPEIRISRLVEAVELQPRLVRVHLQVERRQLRLLLLVVPELGEGSREAVGEDGGHAMPDAASSRSW